MAQVSFGGVTLHVSDLERSKDFYLRIPGSSLEFQQPGRFAVIRIGKGRISLLQMRERDFHIEIGPDNLDELIGQLQGAGIDKQGPQPEQWGQRGMITRDPDGNFVEFDDHLD